MVIKFIKERPQNKIQFHLICNMIKVNPATGDITTEDNMPMMPFNWGEAKV